MLLMMPLRDGMEIEVEDLEDRRWRQNEYGRRLTAQQKDERQDNSDKKRLVRHHPSDLLRSLSRERIGGWKHVANASSFTISNFPCAPHEAPDAHVYT